MHAVKKKEYEKNKKHKTQYVDNGVHSGGTPSPGPSVKMVQATELSVEKSDDVHACVFSIIQGIFPNIKVATISN